MAKATSRVIILIVPRIARIVVPDYPHHVTQRGNNKRDVFFDDEDRKTYLSLLSKYSAEYPFKVWAYCLMPNHVHLLVVPLTSDSLARGVGGTNLVYTQYFNHKYKTSGRLWQNRFYSCIVDRDAYLWEVTRYIERNPVRAKLTMSPEEYLWSSAKFNTGKITKDALIRNLEWIRNEEMSSYKKFLLGEDGTMETGIRQATISNKIFGTKRFIEDLSTRYRINFSVRKRGRPRIKKEVSHF